MITLEDESWMISVWMLLVGDGFYQWTNRSDEMFQILIWRVSAMSPIKFSTKNVNMQGRSTRFCDMRPKNRRWQIDRRESKYYVIKSNVNFNYISERKNHKSLQILNTYLNIQVKSENFQNPRVRFIEADIQNTSKTFIFQNNKFDTLLKIRKMYFSHIFF